MLMSECRGRQAYHKSRLSHRLFNKRALKMELEELRLFPFIAELLMMINQSNMLAHILGHAVCVVLLPTPEADGRFVDGLVSSHAK